MLGLSAMMLAMSSFREDVSITESEDRLQATAEQLRSAVRHLQALSPLTIRRLAFCNRINSFGNIETFPTTDFNPGQPLLIYAEIENFRSERSFAGTYESRFSAHIEILRNNESEPVESIRVAEIIDESTSPRTDYFQSYELTIPQLAPGRYTLRLLVNDEISSEDAIATLAFHVR